MREAFIYIELILYARFMSVVCLIRSHDMRNCDHEHFAFIAHKLSTKWHFVIAALYSSFMGRYYFLCNPQPQYRQFIGEMISVCA